MSDTENVPADAAPAPVPAKPALEKQNGQTRPVAGSMTGIVWDVADELSKKLGRIAFRNEVLEEYQKRVPNAATSTANTQYARWVTFWGVNDQLRALRKAETAQRNESKNAEKAQAKADRDAKRQEKADAAAAAKAERDAKRQEKADREAKAAAKAASDDTAAKEAAAAEKARLKAEAKEKAEQERKAKAEAEAAEKAEKDRKRAEEKAAKDAAKEAAKAAPAA